MFSPFNHINLKLIVAVLLFFSVKPLMAQVEKEDDIQNNLENQNTIEQLIENIAEQQEDTEVDYTNLLEDLSIFLTNPINLNYATREELELLIILDEIKINSILEYRKKYGLFVSHYELVNLDGFDATTVKRIIPFTIVTKEEKKLDFKDIFRRGKSTVLVRYQSYLEEQTGYSKASDSLLNARPNARYLGNNNRYFVRYRFNYKNAISAGFTAEKDPGEQFFRGTQKNGFDFYSAHLYYRNPRKFIKTIAIGDFQAQFGQGLTFWSGLAFGLNPSDITNGKRNAPGLRQYTSANEANFLRGLGTTLKFKNFELTGFYSIKKFDAGFEEADTTSENAGELIVTSFLETGFHRTPSELEKKNKVVANTFGGNFSFIYKTFKIGITSVSNQFNANFIPNQSRVQAVTDLFRYQTQNFYQNTGIDYSWNLNFVNLFGEVSRSHNNAVNYMAGLIAPVDQRLSLMVIYRNYDKAYQAFQPYYNPLVRESSSLAERGLLIGMKILPARNFSLNTYFEQFTFPWLKYRIDKPSTGSDFLAQLNYSPLRRFSCYTRYRRRDRYQNSSLESDIDFVTPTLQQNIRLHFNYSANSQISFANRIEKIIFEKDGEKKEGLLMFADVKYQFEKIPLSLTARYAVFSSDDFDARLYAYESDVLYSFSIPAYLNNGNRIYVMAKYALNNNLDIWIRWAQSFYYDRTSVGSGLDESLGSERNELKIQLKYNF